MHLCLWCESEEHLYTQFKPSQATIATIYTLFYALAVLRLEPIAERGSNNTNR